jgi:tetratricopeptide (TPR) repeat protein
LEHLHPNKEGHFIMAKAFYDLMKKNNFINSNWEINGIDKEKDQGFTELDSIYAAFEIRYLKGGWPFQPKSLPNRSFQNFHPQNLLEEISLKMLHVELGKYYEKHNEQDKALAEYYALITSIPQEIEFYRKAAIVLLEKKDYQKASALLETSLKYKGSPFAYKWIGQIALMNEDNKEAISFLLKADLLDPQVVFNLSRAYYSDNQWYKGEEYFSRLKNLSPKREYISYINKLREDIKIKNQKK